MRSAMLWFIAPLALAAGLSAQPAAAAEPLDKAKEEAALQKNAEAFVEAFDSGDAKALAAFFTEDADLIDQDGRHIQGRKAIEAVYAKLFSETKGAKLFIRISSLRVVRPDLALEDGLTEVVPGDGGPPSAARYSVVHVKQDGKWRLESVREAAATPPNNTENLEDLAFLIGDWTEDVDKGGSATASYAWDENQNFILNTFDVAHEGHLHRRRQAVDRLGRGGQEAAGLDLPLQRRLRRGRLDAGRRQQVEDRGRRHAARRQEGDGDERADEDRRQPLFLPVHRPDPGRQAAPGHGGC